MNVCVWSTESVMSLDLKQPVYHVILYQGIPGFQM